VGWNGKPQILLCADAPAAVEDLRDILEHGGYGVAWQSLDAEDGNAAARSHLLVVEASRRTREGFQFCLRLRARLTDAFVPILLVTDDHAPATRQASLECGADTYLLRPFTSGEVQRINKRLQQAHQQIDQELELARRIQRSFLPQTLPRLSPAHFGVCYRPCDRVGGDFYDVFRLDEHHVGFYLADAMGHGVPASLLAVFLKRAVHSKEIFGNQYRLVPPAEVLQRLNRDLIEQASPENAFITMIYGLFDCRDQTLSFARAGHPHPVYVPQQGEPRLWQCRGGLLGVFDTHFAAQSHCLQSGDKLLFYTDGLVPGDGTTTPGTERVLLSAGQHRHLAAAEFVEALARDLVDGAAQADDVTLLALEIGEGPAGAGPG
jgi:sigma-B regulation protein RsbU (phosphoserine phosphatase)